MKRVLRSALDPLPRALSTKSLVALVAAVVLGIGVTVLRYVESSSPRNGRTISSTSDYGPATPSSAFGSSSRTGEVRAAGPTVRSGASGVSSSAGSSVSIRGVEASVRRMGSANAGDATPSSTAFDPSAQQGG